MSRKGVTLGDLELVRSTYHSGLLILNGREGFYADVVRKNGKTFLEACRLPDFDANWGSGSFNYNRWFESLERIQLPDEAAEILEPMIGENYYISKQETLSALIEKIGKDKVIKAVHDIIKDKHRGS